MVTDDDASRAVWLDPAAGALGGLRPGAVAVETSTLTPVWVRNLGARIIACGNRFLDAPVVGSRPQAEAGQLVFLAGGSAEDLALAAPVLAAMGGTVRHVGGVGAGAACKLAVNTLFASQVATYAEVAAYLASAGVGKSDAAALFKSLPVTSPALARIADLITAGSFRPNFPIALVAKDLGYAAEAMAAAGITHRVAGRMHELFSEAAGAGFGGDDIAGVARLYDAEPSRRDAASPN